MNFSSLSRSLLDSIGSYLKGGSTQQEILDFKKEIFKSLIEADIQMEIAYKIAEEVKERAINEKPPVGVSRRKHLISIIYDELVKVMGTSTSGLNLEKHRVNILMVLGIQGSGKTTSIGKLARLLKQEGWHIGLVCTDTWRPGAYDQLQQLGAKVGVDTYGEPEEGNAEVIAQNGIKYFKQAEKNLIIVDTAGRHKDETSLFEEIPQLTEVIDPHEIILVIDGTLGQKTYSHAQAFAETTPIGSIIVTKLDGTAKGGAAISAAAATGAPLKFIGRGEELVDFEKFDPKGFASRILGMGDLSAIIEEVQRAQITTDDERMKQMMKGNISYEDMLDMFESMHQLGGIDRIKDKVPGLSNLDADSNLTSHTNENMDVYRSIIFSMTPSERKGHQKLSSTRIERIAKGSGVPSTKVKELKKQKEWTAKWIRQMSKGNRRRGSNNRGGFPFDIFGLNG